MNRRSFLRWHAAFGLSALIPDILASAQAAELRLTATPGVKKIVGPDFPATRVWTFNHQIPGTPVRLTHGQSLAVNVENALDVPTSVHWHGIRLPNAMDGVAGLTQSAILPGESFRYQFTPPDSGTYWYHSHVNAHEQIGRGMYGPLIIEEREPPTVDRDLTWMIDDWRLLDDASISGDFESGHDRSHAGRIGNVPTVNGRFRDVIKVRTGERIRLRLINASNARNFALSFDGLAPVIVAIDGQAIKPRPADGPVVIGASGRVDLMLDMTGDPGTTQVVSDSFYRQSFALTTFVYDDSPLRDSPLSAAIELPHPQIPEPDLGATQNVDVVLGGGAMGGLPQAKFDGKWMALRELARMGYVWAINDIVGNKLEMQPLIDAAMGTSIRVTIRNDTAFPHPMHLHGHHMKLLSIDGQALKEPYWVDSPLVMPRQTVELAFVADNPGDWLFHCHVLEHHMAGLGALVRVT